MHLFGLETPFLPYSILSSRPVIITKIAVSGTVTILAWFLAIYSIIYILRLVPFCTSLEPRNLPKDKERQRYMMAIDIASAFCVISHAMWPTFLLFQTSGLISTPHACSVWTRTEYYVIGIARTSFYVILALRTRTAFLNTIMNLTKWQLGLILFVVVGGMQSQTVWSMVVQPTVLLPIPSMQMTTCLVVWDIVVVVVYGMTDVAFTFYLMYLFGRKLAAVFRRDEKTMSGKAQEEKMEGALRKWMLLGWVSIGGTWFLQCFGLFLSLMEISGSLDSLLNIICVIAVYRDAEGLYQHLCSKCESCCDYMGCLYVRGGKELELATQIVVLSQSGKSNTVSSLQKLPSMMSVASKSFASSWTNSPRRSETRTTTDLSTNPSETNSSGIIGPEETVSV